MAFPRSVVQFYIDVFKERKWGIIAYYVTRMIYRGTSSILPAFLAKYIVGALETKPVGQLVMADVMPVLFMLSAWIVVFIMSDLVNHMLECVVYPKTKKASHVKMYQYLIDKSMAFYKSHSSGYLASQAKYVINGTWSLLFKYPCLLLAMLVGVIGNMGMLLNMNWIFVAIIASVLGFRVLHAALNCKKLSESYVAYSEEAAVVSGKNIDILSNFLNLKIFGCEKKEGKYIGEYFDKWVRAKEHSLWLELKFFALPMTFEFIGLIIIMFLLSHLYIGGQISLADVAFVISAFFSVRSCVVNFVWEVPDFMDIYYSAAQAFENLTRTSPELCDVQCGTKQCHYDSVIQFNNVSFKYDTEWVLRDINLCIKKGERIGIVGTSGSGKTTLVNLLMHLYDVTCGSIKIDNTDIRDLSRSSLKKVVSFVPQESILFNRTLADNISYGVGNVSRAQIINAAKKAQAHDFIMKTENGYDTVVGDRGVKLSGGQRQRITIAHAILKNSPILLLDEATSALDSETESNIQESLDGLMRNRTTIAIAHRLSTLKQMDRIIVMDAGRIVESGTHSELLKKRGVYYKLWKMQYSGFM